MLDSTLLEAMHGYIGARPVGGHSMDTLVWRDDYSVGHAVIDDQHKELFRRINLFGDGLWEGHGKDRLEKHLRFLAEYVVAHFKTEERLMEMHRYAHFTAHKSEHDAFVKDVTDLLDQIGGEGLDSSTAVVAFERSCEWTRAHVRERDQELGKFLSQVKA
jgi:hemerythrin-like metal-binding protein